MSLSGDGGQQRNRLWPVLRGWGLVEVGVAYQLEVDWVTGMLVSHEPVVVVGKVFEVPQALSYTAIPGSQEK